MVNISFANFSRCYRGYSVGMIGFAPLYCLYTVDVGWVLCRRRAASHDVVVLYRGVRYSNAGNEEVLYRTH